MIKKFVVYDKVTGAIGLVGYTHVNAIDCYKSHNKEALLVDDDVSIEGVLYFDFETQQIQQAPSSPSANHEFNYATKRWELNEARASDFARAQRDRLLTACDWTQLDDVPLATKRAWVAYRQALRDLTKQPGFPTEIQWPTSP